LNLIGWCCFVVWQLCKNLRSIQVIHACNVDSAILAYPFKLLGKKLVFDIYDSERPYIAERYIAKKADVLLLPHRKRLEQIHIVESDAKHVLEVENVPSFHDLLHSNRRLNSDKIKLAYVGVFEKNDRGIENLLRFVKDNPFFTLDIAGVGGGLEEMVAQFCSECDRICYHGQVSYDKALAIMAESNFIMALYYPSNPAHKYASPNKYYESLFLGVPIVSSKDTLVGEQIEVNNTGYTIGDNIDDLKELFKDIDDSFCESYDEKSRNCKMIWAKYYSNYYKEVIIGNYINKVKQLMTR